MCCIFILNTLKIHKPEHFFADWAWLSIPLNFETDQKFIPLNNASTKS